MSDLISVLLERASVGLCPSGFCHGYFIVETALLSPPVYILKHAKGVVFMCGQYIASDLFYIYIMSETELASPAVYSVCL